MSKIRLACIILPQRAVIQTRYRRDICLGPTLLPHFYSKFDWYFPSELKVLKRCSFFLRFAMYNHTLLDLKWWWNRRETYLIFSPSSILLYSFILLSRRETWMNAYGNIWRFNVSSSVKLKWSSITIAAQRRHKNLANGYKLIELEGLRRLAALKMSLWGIEILTKLEDTWAGDKNGRQHPIDDLILMSVCDTGCR